MMLKSVRREPSENELIAGTASQIQRICLARIFFDPNADTPQPISRAGLDEMMGQIRSAAGKAGTRPELIHAMKEDRQDRHRVKSTSAER